MENRIFLGGTCNETTWRDEVIEKLKINYFNPIVKNWTPKDIEIENNEKESKTYLFRANLDVAIALCLAGLGFKELPRRKEEDISKLLK